MDNFLTKPGFLGTNAPFIIDLTLVATILSAILFSIGFRLARLKKFEAHRWVQTSAVALNALVVLGVMVRSYIIHILPGIPSKLSEGDYAVSTLHAIVGTCGFLLGIFIVLRANNLVPKSLQFKNYKAFMRTSYTLYMLATLLGVIVYVLVYILGI